MFHPSGGNNAVSGYGQRPDNDESRPTGVCVSICVYIYILFILNQICQF